MIIMEKYNVNAQYDNKTISKSQMVNLKTIIRNIPHTPFLN